jgi:nucleoside-diphosphate-sugar epimerase
MTAYVGAKALAETAVWDLVDANLKDLDVTAFCPPIFYGPFAPGFSIPTPDYAAMSSTKYIYRLLTPAGTFPPFAGRPLSEISDLIYTDSPDTLSGYIDVRDLARAHIGALNSPPEAAVGRKRLLMASPHDLNYKTAIDFIAEKRPELRDRLADETNTPKITIDKMILDIQRVEEVTGVKVDSYISWQDTILESVDDLIKLEKDWVSKGFSVDGPPA